MAKTIELCKVHSFSTSPNLCQRTTMWNTHAPKRYITQRLFVASNFSIHNFISLNVNLFLKFLLAKSAVDLTVNNTNNC